LILSSNFSYASAGRERISELLEPNERLDLPVEWVFGLGGLDTPPLSIDPQLKTFIWLIQEAANLREALTWAHAPLIGASSPVDAQTEYPTTLK
jgi:hypothetical protein